MAENATGSYKAAFAQVQEMIQAQKTGFLFEKNNPEALSRSIIDLFDKKEDYGSNIIEFRKQFSWNYFIDEMISLYERRI